MIYSVTNFKLQTHPLQRPDETPSSEVFFSNFVLFALCSFSHTTIIDVLKHNKQGRGSRYKTQVVLNMPMHFPGLGFDNNEWVHALVVQPVNSDHWIHTSVSLGTGKTTY